MLLTLPFPDWRSVAMILINIPFALIGGVIAVAFTGASISIGALIGFVALFGISAHNTSKLISHYEHLIHDEGAAWNRFTALRGARERLTPILMTAMVTAHGLSPPAIGSGEAGRAVEGPMAIAILGGLISSTFLNLLSMPLLAHRHLSPHLILLCHIVLKRAWWRCNRLENTHVRPCTLRFSNRLRLALHRLIAM